MWTARVGWGMCIAAALAACGVDEPLRVETETPSVVSDAGADVALDAAGGSAGTSGFDGSAESAADVVLDTGADVLADASGDAIEDAAPTLVPDFALSDENPASASHGQLVSPRDYLGKVSAWYFGHST